MIELINSECIAAMREMDDCSVDSVVTDPPYHLTSIVKRLGKQGSSPARFGTDGAFASASRGFMGKEWDGGDIAFRTELWEEIYRVLKPGGHVLAFSGSRTYHRMAVAIEDAGRFTQNLHTTSGKMGFLLGVDHVASDTQLNVSVTVKDFESSHPTVKPTELMRYLCKLVTPPGGIVLDPFMGSGSTGKASRLEGFQFIGVEMEAEYFEIAKSRINSVIVPMV